MNVTKNKKKKKKKSNNNKKKQQQKKNNNKKTKTKKKNVLFIKIEIIHQSLRKYSPRHSYSPSTFKIEGHI